MKPEKLILEGVYSYKHRTEIDFSTLCEADLFGIFGNVGSGKSAILESVTYVLYGKIERLSNRVYYNMMNLASDRMFIDFTFTHKKDLYRFTFETKRNKKDFDKIETPQRSAYRKDGEDWIPLFDKDGEVSADGIIDLNYDNFRRTVIVPQGKFQEFLHLEKSSRTGMLMELFRLNRFDLFAKAASLGTQNKEKLDNAEGELKGLEGVSEEAVAETETEIVSVNEALAGLELKIEENTVQLQQWEELAALYKELEAAEAGLAAGNARADEIEERKKNLNVFEDCRGRFKAKMDVYNILAADYKTADEQLGAAGLKIETGRNNLRLADDELKKLETAYKNIDSNRKRAEWFKELAGIEADRKAANRIAGRLKTIQAEIEQMQTAREQLAGELDGLRTQLSDTGTGDYDVELMSRLKGMYSSLAACVEAAGAESERLAKAEAELAELEAGAAAFSDIEQEAAGLEQREAALRQRQLDADVMKEVGRLSGGLEDGKPCPVCGSLTHPAPAAASGSLEGELEDEAVKISAEAQRLKERRENFAILKARISTAAGQAEGSRERLDSCRLEKDSLTANFPDCRYSPDKPDEFNLEYEAFLTGNRLRTGLQAGVTDLATQLDKLSNEIQLKNTTFGSLQVEAASTDSRIAGVEARIDAAFLDDNHSRSAAELEAESKSLLLSVESTLKQYATAEAQKKSAEVSLEKSRTEHEMLETRVAELSDKKMKITVELDELLLKSDYQSLEDVALILGKNLDPVSERNEIESFEKELAAEKVRIDSLRQKINGRKYAAAEHSGVQESIRLQKIEREQAMNRKGELGNILKDLKIRLERKESLEKDLSALQIRGRNISTLKNLFKGKKFIDYAATIYLRDLCEAANARFRKLTRESLRLELDESNNFIIRDYLNEGRTRSVKTLSGGQTFQAAFSLSLALADSIGRERSGFFFLDEGFGSLDKESLSLVFESLKSLKSEDRTVGIISHVEDLKQEIDTFITVKKDNDEGSIITNSWNGG